jgi:hypothetical protein
VNLSFHQNLAIERFSFYNVLAAMKDHRLFETSHNSAPILVWVRNSPDL